MEKKKRKLVCLRCGYRWAPKLKGRAPVECPDCKSRKWNLRRR